MVVPFAVSWDAGKMEMLSSQSREAVILHVIELGK
jgi:hypothetical protein